MAIPGRDDLDQQASPLAGRVWRAVEAQHYAATRKLVGTHADQERLEELLEGSKPEYPPGTEHLDYLLKTPFRYRPPKRGGSRFRRPFAPYRVFYAAERIRTALAELAFHRYRFFRASEGTDLPGQEAQLTVFAAYFATEMGIDLTVGDLAHHRALWTHPSDYSATQGLGETAAEANFGAIRYESVRDPETDHHGNGAGRNVGLLSPEVFLHPDPLQPQTWYLYLGLQEANARRALAGPGERFDFPRAMLEMAGPPI